MGRGGGKREEGIGKREKGRGKREEGKGKARKIVKKAVLKPQSRPGGRFCG